MTCRSVGTAIVCGPPAGVYKRLSDHACPSCETTHDFIERWDGAWYGVTLFGSCGDTFADGWRMPRPFRRYWRRDAQKRFQARWDNAAPTDLYEAYTRADIDSACMSDNEDLSAAFDRRRVALNAIHAHQGDSA